LGFRCWFLGFESESINQKYNQKQFNAILSSFNSKVHKYLGFVFSPDRNGILLFSFFNENKRYSGELE
jgi:hypothetical protein